MTEATTDRPAGATGPPWRRSAAGSIDRADHATARTKSGSGPGDPGFRLMTRTGKRSLTLDTVDKLAAVLKLRLEGR
jgi:hypothetical protein